MAIHRLPGVLMAATMSACSLLVDFPECEEDLDCAAAQMCVATVCTAIEVTEDIRTDAEWTADRIYLPRAPVYVHPQKTLTIRAGTTIRGSTGSARLVRSGGRLDARGSREPRGPRCSARPET